MKTKSPMKAIREKCIDCCGDQFNEVKACHSLDCPLWKFRLGLHPYTQKNVGNPFLDPNNFVKQVNQTSFEVIEKINQTKQGLNDSFE